MKTSIKEKVAFRILGLKSDKFLHFSKPDVVFFDLYRNKKWVGRMEIDNKEQKRNETHRN